jgi:hypothetical protein
MMLVLTCALCVSAPDTLTAASSARPALLEAVLTLGQVDHPSPTAPLLLALGRMEEQQGAGDGDHSDRISPMWIMMGVMMAVMVVGMGVYLMRQSATGQVVGNAALASPAQLALPVSVARGGGG